jgi:hypothetical protein
MEMVESRRLRETPQKRRAIHRTFESRERHSLGMQYGEGCSTVRQRWPTIDILGSCA